MGLILRVFWIGSIDQESLSLLLLLLSETRVELSDFIHLSQSLGILAETLQSLTKPSSTEQSL